MHLGLQRGSRVLFRAMKIHQVDNIGAAFTSEWNRVVVNHEIRVTGSDGSEGWVDEDDNGDFVLMTKNKATGQVEKAEAERDEGRLKLGYSPLREKRFGFAALQTFGDTTGPAVGAKNCVMDCLNDPENGAHKMSIVSRKPCLAIEGHGMLLGAIPNGFPYYALGHWLLLMAVLLGNVLKYPHVPQLMTYEFFKNLVRLAAEAAEWVLGWSDLHAGATADHAHAHLFRSKRPLPAETWLQWQIGGMRYLVGYPAGCLVFDTSADVDTLWRAICRLQANKAPFNLVVRGHQAYLFGRAKGGEVVPEAPWGVLAICELMGYHIISNKTVFETVREQVLFEAMRKTTIPIEELWGMIRA